MSQSNSQLAPDQKLKNFFKEKLTPKQIPSASFRDRIVTQELESLEPPTWAECKTLGLFDNQKTDTCIQAYVKCYIEFGCIAQPDRQGSVFQQAAFNRSLNDLLLKLQGAILTNTDEVLNLNNAISAGIREGIESKLKKEASWLSVQKEQEKFTTECVKKLQDMYKLKSCFDAADETWKEMAGGDFNVDNALKARIELYNAQMKKKDKVDFDTSSISSIIKKDIELLQSKIKKWHDEYEVKYNNLINDKINALIYPKNLSQKQEVFKKWDELVMRIELVAQNNDKLIEIQRKLPDSSMYNLKIATAMEGKIEEESKKNTIDDNIEKTIVIEVNDGVVKKEELSAELAVEYSEDDDEMIVALPQIKEQTREGENSTAKPIDKVSPIKNTEILIQELEKLDKEVLKREKELKEWFKCIDEGFTFLNLNPFVLLPLKGNDDLGVLKDSVLFKNLAAEGEPIYQFVSKCEYVNTLATDFAETLFKEFDILKNFSTQLDNMTEKMLGEENCEWGGKRFIELIQGDRKDSFLQTYGMNDLPGKIKQAQIIYANTLKAYEYYKSEVCKAAHGSFQIDDKAIEIQKKLESCQKEITAKQEKLTACEETYSKLLIQKSKDFCTQAAAIKPPSQASVQTLNGLVVEIKKMWGEYNDFFRQKPLSGQYGTDTENAFKDALKNILEKVNLADISSFILYQCKQLEYMVKDRKNGIEDYQSRLNRELIFYKTMYHNMALLKGADKVVELIEYKNNLDLIQKGLQPIEIALNEIKSTENNKIMLQDPAGFANSFQASKDKKTFIANTLEAAKNIFAAIKPVYGEGVLLEAKDSDIVSYIKTAKKELKTNPCLEIENFIQNLTYIAVTQKPTPLMYLYRYACQCTTEDSKNNNPNLLLMRKSIEDFLEAPEYSGISINDESKVAELLKNLPLDGFVELQGILLSSELKESLFAEAGKKLAESIKDAFKIKLQERLRQQNTTIMSTGFDLIQAYSSFALPPIDNKIDVQAKNLFSNVIVFDSLPNAVDLNAINQLFKAVCDLYGVTPAPDVTNIKQCYDVVQSIRGSCTYQPINCFLSNVETIIFHQAQPEIMYLCKQAKLSSGKNAAWGAKTSQQIGISVTNNKNFEVLISEIFNDDTDIDVLKFLAEKFFSDDFKSIIRGNNKDQIKKNLDDSFKKKLKEYNKRDVLFMGYLEAYVTFKQSSGVYSDITNMLQAIGEIYDQPLPTTADYNKRDSHFFGLIDKITVDSGRGSSLAKIMSKVKDEITINSNSGVMKLYQHLKLTNEDGEKVANKILELIKNPETVDNIIGFLKELSSELSQSQLMYLVIGVLSISEIPEEDKKTFLEPLIVKSDNHTWPEKLLDQLLDCLNDVKNNTFAELLNESIKNIVLDKIKVKVSSNITPTLAQICGYVQFVLVTNFKIIPVPDNAELIESLHGKLLQCEKLSDNKDELKAVEALLLQLSDKKNKSYDKLYQAFTRLHVDYCKNLIVQYLTQQKAAQEGEEVKKYTNVLGFFNNSTGVDRKTLLDSFDKLPIEDNLKIKEILHNYDAYSLNEIDSQIDDIQELVEFSLQRSVDKIIYSELGTGRDKFNDSDLEKLIQNYSGKYTIHNLIDSHKGEKPLVSEELKKILIEGFYDKLPADVLTNNKLKDVLPSSSNDGLLLVYKELAALIDQHNKNAQLATIYNLDIFNDIFNNFKNLLVSNNIDWSEAVKNFVKLAEGCGEKITLIIYDKECKRELKELNYDSKYIEINKCIENYQKELNNDRESLQNILPTVVLDQRLVIGQPQDKTVPVIKDNEISNEKNKVYKNNSEDIQIHQEDKAKSGTAETVLKNTLSNIVLYKQQIISNMKIVLSAERQCDRFGIKNQDRLLDIKNKASKQIQEAVKSMQGKIDSISADHPVLRFFTLFMGDSAKLVQKIEAAKTTRPEWTNALIYRLKQKELDDAKKEIIEVATCKMQA